VSRILYNTRTRLPAIDKQRPGSGYRHVLRAADVVRFIEILPGWKRLSVGLERILLAAGDPRLCGWHRCGVVAVCAWERSMSVERPEQFCREHEGFLARLGVQLEANDVGVLCKFTEPQVRAWQLLHILLHELGHHRDRMTTRRQKFTGRGEPFAEQYALEYTDRIWDRYVEEFGL
jgi:hypothetical protein